MEINILSFGQIADIFGNNSFKLSNIHSTTELINYLSQKFPQLTTSDYVLAVNQKIISQPTELKENDTIAFLPPFSGG
ncbi:MAG: MoaD/ThiS family protein [Sphingobacteriales bacterium]|nr:MAG: MoaD/ThiS family protein [Sphingobacteriales bacterium]